MSEERNEFTSIEDIDRYLEEEFSKETPPVDTEDEPEEDIDLEDESLEDDEPEGDEEVEEESDEEDESDESEDEPEDDEPEVDEHEVTKKPSKEDKSNHAFAKLRQEAKENKQKAEEYNAVIDKLMREAGYTDFNQFKKAVEEQLDEKEREKAGYTKEEFSRKKDLEAEEKRIREREEALRNQERNTKAKVFNDAVTKFAQDYGMGENGSTEIYNRLEKLNYTADLLLAQPDPYIVIKGAMADVVEKKALASYKEKASNKKKVDSGKLTTRSNDDNLEDQLDKLLEQDLREYAKRRGIKYDD